MEASAYPHLINLIFKFAPRGSLLQLRGVNRAFLHAADEVLAYHLDICREHGLQDGTAPGEAKDSDITTPSGRHPAFYGWTRLYDPDTHIYDDDALEPHEWFHPACEGPCTTKCYALRARRSRFLKGVRVVDVPGWPLDRERAEELFTAIGHPTVVRLLDSRHLQFPWPPEMTNDMVYIQANEGMEDLALNFPLYHQEDDESDYDSDNDEEGYVPPKQTLVLNFTGPGVLVFPAHIDWMERLYRRKISGLVCIYSGREGALAEEPSPVLSADPSQVKQSLILATASISEWIRQGIDCTLVGMDALLLPRFTPEGWRPGTPESIQAWKDLIDDYVHCITVDTEQSHERFNSAHLHSPYLDEAPLEVRTDLPRVHLPDDKPGTLRFLSVEEYRATVTPFQFDLHMYR